MDTELDPRDADLIAALQHNAEIPLGLTARLEVSVARRAREATGFTLSEKVIVLSFGLGALVQGSGAGATVLLLVAALGTLGYAQWTVLLDEEA
jgi:hypothetical protein